MNKPEIITKKAFVAAVAAVADLKNFVGTQSNLTGSWKHTGNINEYGVEYSNVDNSDVVTLSAVFFKRTKGMPTANIPNEITLSSVPSTTQYTAQSYAGWEVADKKLRSLGEGKDNSKELKTIFEDLYKSELRHSDYCEFKMNHVQTAEVE